MLKFIFGKQPRLELNFISGQILKLELVKKTIIISLLARTIFPAAFLGFFYYHILDHMDNNIFEFFIFILTPAFIIYGCLRDIRMLINNENFVFNLKEEKIIRNNKLVKLISDVKCIEVEENSGDNENIYKLNIVFIFRGEKMEIDRSSDEQEIYSLANQIADFLNIKITKA